MIQQVREKQAAYNLITNNCQTYALRLLDAIKADGANHFPTTLNVYQTLIGPGKVLDLFQAPEGAPPTDDTVATAQSCMNAHTTQLDTHGPAVDPSNPQATQMRPPAATQFPPPLPPQGSVGGQGGALLGGEGVHAEGWTGEEGGGETEEAKKKKGILARMFGKKEKK